MEYLFNFESLLDDLFHKKSKIEVELDETEIHSNLDIFTTGVNNKNRSVFNTLVEPITKQGVIYLQKRLSQSRTLQEIKREQKELIFLLKNPEILNEIYTILRFIQKQEDSLLWCITDKTGSEIDSLSSGYFQHEFLQFLNKYSSVLFLMNVFTLLIAPIYSTLSPVIITIMPYFYFKFFTKIPVSFGVYFKIVKNQLFNFPKISMIKKMTLFSILTKLLSWIIYFQSVYSNTKTSQKTKVILIGIQEKLESIVKIVKLNNNLHQILETTPIEHQVINRNSILPKHKSFEKVFNSYTHDWSPVLQEYNKIIQFVSVKEKLREDIKHMYQSWGHIDFLVSLARTLIEGEWCIPYFRKDNIPYLSIKDMYHPSLKGSCIKNTIKMENENMLITGPNASGKSTLLKTTAIGVFLAHRLGIAPGKRMETSYFRYIYTHLNIQDATGKESLFQREANKIKKQIQMMNQKDGLHFSIIDELFHSTNPGEAVKGAKWILSQINNNPRVMCLLSTHFHDLTVSDSSIDKFKCYHIPFIRDEKGKIKYTYTLQPGVSQQNVALEILQNTDD